MGEEAVRHNLGLPSSCRMRRMAAGFSARAAMPANPPRAPQMFSTVFEKLAGEPAWQKILDK